MEVIYQGNVATDGSTQIVCTATSMVVNEIIINNTDNNYNIIMNRFMTGEGIHLIPIYEFALDLGDTVRDTEGYLLRKGNYLQLITNIIGTTYYISATETE
jgi:hypothetical protein